MLANYAQFPFFQTLLAQANDPTTSQPQDFVLTFWSSDLGYQPVGTTVADRKIYDVHAGTVNTMCDDATQASDAAADWPCVPTLNGKGVTQEIDGGHGADYANVLVVRPLGAGEIYGGS
jgi:hypothetical protein